MTKVIICIILLDSWEIKPCGSLYGDGINGFALCIFEIWRNVRYENYITVDSAYSGHLGTGLKWPQ